ncbi:unnamed protein product [Peniophora sp. CBMAI 1063]|nr:unnamed protein product [Peniophora sp. CBMAI 1063]
MPPIRSTLARNYDSFSSRPLEERQTIMESWRALERSIEDGSYHRATLEVLKDDRRKYGRSKINTKELQLPVLPSLEKRIPQPPPPPAPKAYEYHVKIVPIPSSDLSLELIQRSSTHLDIFILDKDGTRVQIPPHLELVDAVDMRPVESCAIQPDMPYSMWSIVKSERYALVGLDAGAVICHLKFRWEVRVFTPMHVASA